MQKVEIRVRGHLDQDWSRSLGGLSITHTPEGLTLLTGSVRDQAALQGLLERIAGLGLELVSVNVNRNVLRQGGTRDVKRA